MNPNKSCRASDPPSNRLRGNEYDVLRAQTSTRETMANEEKKRWKNNSRKRAHGHTVPVTRIIIKDEQPDNIGNHAHEEKNLIFSSARDGRVGQKRKQIGEKKGIAAKNEAKNTSTQRERDE
jgi:hypothetical protein